MPEAFLRRTLVLKILYAANCLFCFLIYLQATVKSLKEVLFLPAYPMMFGNTKQNKGFRRFMLRGKPKVTVEFEFIAIAHNLKNRAD